MIKQVDAIDKWVANLNKLACDMDETAHSMHPSAWAEALKDDNERFRKLAASGPKGN